MSSVRSAALPAALTLAASLQAGGFYTVTRTAQGPWAFLDPAGKPFISMGVCAANPFDGSIPANGSGYDQARDAKIPAWAERTAARLKQWGFNSLGAWCHPSLAGRGLAFSVELALSGYDDRANCLVDLWDDSRAAKLRQNAERGTAPYRDDAQLLGYYLDNELPWFGDTGWPGPHNTPLLDKYLALPSAAPGKAQAVQAVMAYYHDDLRACADSSGLTLARWDALLEPLAPGTASWPEELAALFAGRVAERYFEITLAAVRASDPRHLVLGVRFAGSAPDPVIAAARGCDVVSVNSYQKGGRFDEALFDRVHLLTRRPLLLTEYSWRADENRSGNKNRRGADVSVATQAERAQRLQSFLPSGLALPYFLGAHWFQYADEPTPGRSFDGEDSDYGLVDVRDQPYGPLVAAHRVLNAGALKAHLGTTRPYPTALPRERPITVRRALGAGTGSAAVPADPSPFGATPALAVTWAAADAKISVSAEAGGLRVDYDTGQDWGCGISLKPQRPGLADGSADLMGSEAVAIPVSAVAGLKLQVFADESGCDDPAKSPLKGEAGADGESYCTGLLRAQGGAQRLRLVWDAARLRNAWGEQHGNRTVDLQAIKAVALYLPGHQGKGTLWIGTASAER